MANLICFSNLSYADESKSKSEPSARSVGQLVLDAQFNGPFKDTLIQRWVDVSASAICYLYIPVTLPAMPAQQNGSSQDTTRIYGSNSMGSISCIPAQIKPK
jgi:hypothetical protein